MALPDDFLDRLIASSTRRCKFGSWLRAQSLEDIKTIEDSLSSKVATTVLHQHLRTMDGYAVSRHTLGEHRNGACICPLPSP